MHPILLSIGPINIYTYGVFIASAFFLGIGLAVKEAKKEGIDPQKILDLSFYILIAAIVGSRIFYVIINFRYFIENPLEIIKIWSGGLVFYGGFVIGIVVVIYFFKKNNMPLWKTADVIAPSIPIGQAVGRLGCFFAGCCYGKPTNLPWGVTFSDPNSLAKLGVPLHPTQLYSSLNGLIIFFILIIIRRYKRFDGELIWIYVLLYSVGRFIIEFFRSDDRGIILDTLSTSQVIGIILFITAITMLIKLKDGKAK